MKYTDEQLSRILGEHDAAQLTHGGLYEWGAGCGVEAYPRGCVNQAAYNEPRCSVAFDLNKERGIAFDNGYHPDYTPESLLALLEG